jgi:hypothetical protein
LKKLQLKLSRSTTAIYPYEKPLLTVSQESSTEISLVPKNADTLFSVQKMKTSINFWHLLLGDVQLGTLEIKTEWYNSYKGNVKNFAAFLKKDNGESTTNEKKIMPLCL